MHSHECKTLVRGWKTYQNVAGQLDAIFLPKVTAAGIELAESAQARLHELRTEAQASLPGIKLVIGVITVFQALWRPLNPEETRKALATKCRKVLESREVQIPAPLSLMWSIVAGQAEA